MKTHSINLTTRQQKYENVQTATVAVLVILKQNDMKGPTEIWTRVTGFRVQCPHH